MITYVPITANYKFELEELFAKVNFLYSADGKIKFFVESTHDLKNPELPPKRNYKFVSTEDYNTVYEFDISKIPFSFLKHVLHEKRLSK